MMQGDVLPKTDVRRWLIVSQLIMLLALPVCLSLAGLMGLAADCPSPCHPNQDLISGATFGFAIPPLALVLALLAWIPYGMKQYAAAALMSGLAVAAFALVGCWWLTMIWR